MRLQRRIGWTWLALWIVTLNLVASPWRALGGVVDERLRWLEWVVLAGGPPIGFTVGRFAREAAEENPRWTYPHVVRGCLLPPASLTALTMLALAAAGVDDPIGVVLTAFLSYWAGLDLAFGALPLMEGKPIASALRVAPEIARSPAASGETLRKSVRPRTTPRASRQEKSSIRSRR